MTRLDPLTYLLNGHEKNQALAQSGHACNCIGPQNNEPKCPCMMKGVTERDGRWIESERDLGPVLKSPNVPTEKDSK